jgi:ketosteroid isomerase-like protein
MRRNVPEETAVEALARDVAAACTASDPAVLGRLIHPRADLDSTVAGPATGQQVIESLGRQRGLYSFEITRCTRVSDDVVVIRAHVRRQTPTGGWALTVKCWVQQFEGGRLVRSRSFQTFAEGLARARAGTAFDA